MHILDSLIPLSDQTIAEVLRSQSDRFSTFSDLLDKAEITQFLDRNGKSRTVLAPTNDALDKLPSGALECLCQEDNRRSLNQFVLIHISYPTEYNSTLSQRSHIQTFTSRPNYWLIITAEDDSTSVTREKITIEELDIPASNGVIHALPEAVVAIDFEKLNCPDVPEPTTPPPPGVVLPGVTTAEPAFSGDGVIDPINVLNADSEDI